MTTTINASTSSGLVNTADTSGILQLQTASTAALTIDASQNVGIGTASPTAKLTIDKSADSASVSRTPADYSIRLTAAQSNTYNGGICVSESTYVNSAITPIDTGSGGAQGWSFITGNNTAIAEAMRIDSSGNVGIGTASPSYKLDVSGTGRVTGDFYVGSSTNIIYESSSNLNIRAANSLLFNTNGANERMRIDSSGNLLVGTTTAGNSSIFTAQQSGANINTGYFRSTNASTPIGVTIEYSAGAPNNTGQIFLNCGDNAAGRFQVRSNGGLANYSANNVNLSDQREKKDIALAQNYLDKICQIPVKTFLFNDQTDTDLNLGAIAQDVQAVCPELVMESNWAGENQPEKMRLSIYQTDLQYALMKSIQELKAINDTQAETINALTARIVALESRGTV